MFYHVKVTPYDLGYVREGGDPIPEGNPFIIIIRCIDVTNPKEGIVNTYWGPNNPIEGGATITSDAVRPSGANEQTNSPPTLEMAGAELDRVFPNDI